VKIKKLELREIIKEEINKLITEDDFDDYMQSITTMSKAQQRSQGAANKATAPMRATRQFLINECGNQKILRAMFGHEHERDIDFNLAEKDWPEYGPVSEQAEDFYFAVSNLVTDWVGDDEYDGRYNPNTTFQYLAPTRARSPYGSMIVNSDGNGPLLVKCKLTIDKYIGLNPESGLEPLEEREPNLYTEGVTKMKVTRLQLKDIIKEEIEALLNEDDFSDYQASAGSEVDCAKLEKQLQSAREQYKSTQPGHHSYYPASEEAAAQTYDALNQISAQWKAKCKGANPAFKVTQRAQE
jgi:hypothetical protein